ncbi:MAG: O-antigen ligase family protein [Coriobacteriia bacterium]|nr:O-antigen ligase family protein [Coriobacteriia bacterium]
MSKSKKAVQARESKKAQVPEHTREGKIAWWLILILVALVPVVMANGMFTGLGINLVDGFDGVKVFVLRIGVMAILAAWVWDMVRNGGEIRYHAAYILVGIFLAWIAITTLTSISPSTAFLGKYRRYDGAWSYLLYALLMFLTMQYATSLPRIRQLAKSITFSSVAVAGYGLLQAIPNPWRDTTDGAIGNWDPLTWGALPFEPLRSFSTFGNPNLLAGFLAFSVFITIGLLFSEEETKWRRWYWFVLLLNSAVSITAFSRSLWVAIPVALALFAFLMWRQKVKPTKDDYFFAGGVAAVVAGFVAFSLTRADDVMNFWTRVQTIFNFDHGSGLTRTQIWEAAAAAIAERPIFGYGLDTFRLIFRYFAPPEYAQAAGFRSVADNAHNFPLQLATGIGIVGALLFFALLLWVAYIAIRACLKNDEELNAGKILFAGITCACLAYCVHLFFGLSLPSTSFLLWILMGVLLVPSAKILQIKKAKWMVPAAVALCSLLLVPVAFSVRLFAADSAYSVPASAVAAGMDSLDPAVLPIVIEDAERMIRLNPFYERYYVDYFIIISHTALAQYSRGDADGPQLIEEAREKARHLIDMSPWEYDSYLAVATFYMNLATATEGEESRAYTEEAIELMRAKIEDVPTGLALRMRYAEALLMIDEVDAAKEELAFVAEHDTNHPSAANMLQSLMESSEENLLQFD